MKTPITVGRAEPLRRALELLIEHGISGLPVVDEGRRLVGVLSERDLLDLFQEPEAKTIERLMSPCPTSFPADAPLLDVVDCLMANDFRRVFVTEGDAVVGVVSRADLMPAILEALIDRC